MANSFDKVVDSIFAMSLKALRENAIMSRLVRSDFSAEVAERGDTINVPVPKGGAVRDYTPGPVPPGGDDSEMDRVPIKLDRWRISDLNMNDKEAAEIVEKGVLSALVSTRVKALANDVDQYLLSKVAGFYGTAGAPGTDPFASDLAEAIAANKLLGEQLAPNNDRYMVLNPAAQAQALALPAIQDASRRASTREDIDNTLRTAMIGELLGFQFFMSQNVQSHTAGDGASVQTAAAAVVGDVSVAVDGGTGNILEGDTFTFAGHSQRYVATATTVAGAGGTLEFYPPLAAVVADNEAITNETTDSALNVAFQRDAIGLAVRPLAPAGGFTGGNVFRSAVDEVSGLAMSLEISREHGRTKWVYSVLYGADVIRPELGVRVAGA